ncbi:MAG TPA: 23S rRNA (adenine(2030)-N(6))-methyltransferase RlmJ [Rhizomicrobium sp.]|nr:23S rRNA (adenine(2030)-N(6))-methyltransferase RlmJ [Rhizomicrobium sp.]
MNYRHAFHAGNFADVVKHLALADILLHLKKKEKPFFVLDTHAGRGIYDLLAEQATRTGESAQGIERLRQLFARKDLPDALKTYFECVAAAGAAHYPGSPLIAAHLLRPQDRLVAVEKHAEEFAVLQSALASFRNAKAVAADGYERIAAFLPPPERRGVVLIDPPYEADDEFARAADALAAAHRRFATGIYLLWFPVKSKSAADGFCGEVLARGAGKILRVDIAIQPKSGDAKERLTSAGLLVINPPFGLDTRMTAIGEIIAPLLSGTIHIEWLAGEN